VIVVTLKKSPIGRAPEQREALRCLGLRRVRQTRQLADHPCTWGQIRKVKHLLELKK